MPTGWRRTVSFIAIILGFFMALLDTTIVNVALPEMTKQFGTDMEGMSWVVNGYNLAFAVFLITASRLADQFGRKRLFMIGVVLFVASSALAGMSGSLALLILFRVLQGLAAAIVVPVTIPLATELFPPRMHGMIIGVWGGISGLAAASGPTLGGLLTDSIGWSSIFYVNLPIGLICIALSWFLLRESYDPSAGRGIDWAGIGLLTAAMFSLTYALIQSNEWGWGSAKLLGSLAVSLLAFLLFILVERRIKEPMLPLWLFRIKTFNWASLTLLVLGAGIMASSFLMSYYLTGLMGKSVLHAGTIISAMPLASMVVSASIGALSNRYGSRFFAAGGLLLMAVSVYSYGSLSPDSALFSVIWRLALTGVSLGLTMAPVMGSVIRNVPQDKVGVASGITNMTRALGSVLGVALLVTLLNSSIGVHAKDAKKELTGAVMQNPAMSAELKDTLVKRIAQAGSQADSSPEAIQGLLAALDQSKEQKLAAAPAESRDQVAAAFDAQKQAVLDLVPQIQKKLTDASAKGFDRTFHIAGIFLVIGAWCGLWSDRRRTAEDKANAAKQPQLQA